MTDLPELAISVRQPWAWALIHAGKTHENRSAGALKWMAPLTGRRAIHASKGMTREKYDDACEFMASEFGIACPAPADLKRGGIIGSVMITGVVNRSESPWFVGPRGLVIEDPQPCDFIPAVGKCFRALPVDIRSQYRSLRRREKKLQRLIAKRVAAHSIHPAMAADLRNQMIGRIEANWNRIKSYFVTPERPIGLDGFLAEVGL